MTRLLTSNGIRRAIYVDFEGRTDLPPVLLGVRWPAEDGTSAIEQIVLDPRFAPAAAARDLQIATIEESIQAVVERAEAEDRLIVGWSQHEVDVVNASCSRGLAERFADRYVDAKATTKATRARLRLELPAARGRERRHALGRYQRLIGFDVPFPFGPNLTGTTIRVVGDALAQHGDWQRLTPRQKTRWSFLLRHNQSDLDGTAAVAAWATAALEAASAQ